MQKTAVYSIIYKSIKGDVMKWSVQQLQKLTSSPLTFVEDLDFTENARDVSDILEIKKLKVSGEITMLKLGTFRVKYHILAPLVLECSLTLEPVDYLFDKTYDEIFSTDATDDDDTFLIEKNTLDLDSAVWSNIIIDKPLSVKHERAYEILAERGIILDETFDDKDE